MLEALLRLIGLGGRRDYLADLRRRDAEQRAAAVQCRARAYQIEMAMQNSQRSARQEHLRAMTEEELAQFNDPERGTGVPVQLGEFSGIRLFGDATLPPGRIEARRSK